MDVRPPSGSWVIVFSKCCGFSATPKAWNLGMARSARALLATTVIAPAPIAPLSVRSLPRLVPFAINLVSFFVLSLVAFRDNAPYLFYAYDGQFEATLIALDRLFVPLQIGLTSNFLQGLGNVWFTMNAKLFPEYLPFFGTDTFPAFYLRSVGLPVSARVGSPAEAAAMLRTHWALTSTGVVLAQPLPEGEAMDTEELTWALAEAQRRARVEKISGPAVTPFLLARLAELTGGRTLRANQALIVANARLAAAVAAELTRG